MNFIDVNPEANRSELFAASWQGRVTVVTPPGPAFVSSPCLVLPNGMAQLRPRLGRLHGKQACGKGEQGHRCCRAPELNWKLRFPRLRHRTCRTRTPSGCHWKEELALLMKLSLTCIMPGQLNPEFCQLHGFVRLCSPFK